MPTVKFINEIILIYFSARTFQLKVDQCWPIFHWSWNFCEMFSLITFFLIFSHEALVTGRVTATNNYQMQLFK